MAMAASETGKAFIISSIGGNFFNGFEMLHKARNLKVKLRANLCPDHKKDLLQGLATNISKPEIALPG